MIGKTIKSILTSNVPLMALVPATKVFPYMANENTAMPAIVYTVDTINPQYTKAGWASDDVTFSVYSSAVDYASLQTIVSAIRTAMEMNNAGAGTQNIGMIMLDSFEEDALPDWLGFYNKLTFKTTVKKY
jgi:hypothetical protein